MSKQSLFKQFSLPFSYIYPIDKTLSSATTPGQSGSGRNGNEGVLHIPLESNITGISPSDYLVSYPGDSSGFFSFAVK